MNGTKTGNARLVTLCAFAAFPHSTVKFLQIQSRVHSLNIKRRSHLFDRFQDEGLTAALFNRDLSLCTCLIQKFCRFLPCL